LSAEALEYSVMTPGFSLGDVPVETAVETATDVNVNDDVLH